MQTLEQTTANTAAAKPNPLLRFFPSLTDVAFLAPVFLLFIVLDGAKRLLGDGDTGWHIRTGEWILANGRVPTIDIFSYTRAAEPWFAWEWLWDVAFGWMHQRFGMEAVVFSSLLVLCFTFALLFRLVRRTCPNSFLAIAVTLVATGASAIHWLARPHLFTMFFTVVFLSILERVRDGRTRLLFALPLLTVLWTNVHGGFFVGILLIGCYAVGELAAATVAVHRYDRLAALRRSRPYLAAAGACFAATFVNPYFYKLHVHIWNYLREPYHRQFITEFMSTSFHPPQARLFEFMIFTGLVAVCWSVYRRRFAQAFLIAGWAHLGLLMGRNIPIFVIVAAPPVAWALFELLEALAGAPVALWLRRAAASVQDGAREFGILDRQPRLHLTAALGALAIGALLYSPAAAGKFRAEYDPKVYPAKALESLSGPEFARGIFTDDEWGDYLAYRFYPNTKVFVDGRSDFYGPEFGHKFLDVMNIVPGWQATLDRYGVHTVLLPVKAPLAGALKESARWKVVYDDGLAIVFRPAPRSEGALSKVLADGGRPRDREITQLQPVIDRSLYLNSQGAK
jgi:hypothetical protein